MSDNPHNQACQPVQGNTAGLSLDGHLQKALVLHQAGDLKQAEMLYRQILVHEPQHPNALYLLGLVQYRHNKPDAALALFDQAIAINPGNAVLYYDRAIALRTLGRDDEALASYDQAIELNDNLPKAHFNRGSLLEDLGRFEEALASYTHVLSLQPSLVNAYLKLGKLEAKLNRLDAALFSLGAALNLQPDSIEALLGCGDVFMTQNLYEQALHHFDRALALQPDLHEVHYNKGIALAALNRIEAAVESYSRVIALKQDYYKAYTNRGILLVTLKHYQAAMSDFDNALAIQPELVEVLIALINKGNLLVLLHRHEDALDCYEKILGIQPDYAQAYNSLGMAGESMGKYEEALLLYNIAQALDSDCLEAFFNESLCLLKMGNLAAGFDLYEWRWQLAKKNPESMPPAFSQPLWLGKEPLADKTILLHPEQGFGDTLQMCRYVEPLAQLGAKVMLEVQPMLKPLLLNLSGTSQVLATGETPPAFDYHCPLMSLPLAFDTRLDSILANIPYLFSTPKAVADWKIRVGTTAKPWIGLAWSGNSAHSNDHNRSIPLAQISPLLSENMQFFCLQRELRPSDEETLKNHQNVHFFGDQLADFSDTAALIELMDLVLCVDTSTAHLAGAMGKPVWLLLPFNPDWRWLLEREDSPWYPTMRLFRQPAMGDWSSVLAKVKAELLSLRF
jgi:tetratricopeptide (TPR) repeat protein